MDDIVRIGKISAIDYKKGTASVVYTDRGSETSSSFPFFGICYEMPKTGDTVVVLLMPNSTTKGFILGTPYSASNVPQESGPGIFYKKFPDGSYVKYDGKSGRMSVSAKEVILQSVTADCVTVKKMEAGEVYAESLVVEETADIKELRVTGTAVVTNLTVTGTAAGHFPS